jgi:hypothetical protein
VWFAYDAYARGIFVEGAYIAASGGIAAVIVAVALSVWRAREVKRVTTYGSARWAETREVRNAGLLGHDGVLLGRWRDHYLRHDGPEHVLCFPFQRDLLARYIAAFLAKPLVILAGVSGTGKSKLAELVAEYYTVTATTQPSDRLDAVIAPVSGDDLEAVSIGTHEKRLQDTARADAWQDSIGDWGGCMSGCPWFWYQSLQSGLRGKAMKVTKTDNCFRRIGVTVIGPDAGKVKSSAARGQQTENVVWDSVWDFAAESFSFWPILACGAQAESIG